MGLTKCHRHKIVPVLAISGFYDLSFPSEKEIHGCEQEQDKSSDIEQQPLFGDRKKSNIQPQNGGGG